METVLDASGRIQLPDVVQAQLGIRPGDWLSIEESAGGWSLKKRSQPTPKIDEEDLNWPDLEYFPVPPKQTKEITVKIELRGRMEPLVHELDEE